MKTRARVTLLACALAVTGCAALPDREIHLEHDTVAVTVQEASNTTLQPASPAYAPALVNVERSSSGRDDDSETLVTLVFDTAAAARHFTDGRRVGPSGTTVISHRNVVVLYAPRVGGPDRRDAIETSLRRLG